MTRPLDKLGRQVREALGPGPSAQRLQAQRRALLEASHSPRPAAPRRVVWALVASVLVAALAWGLKRHEAWSPPKPLAMPSPLQRWPCTDDLDRPILVGASIQSGAESSKALRFEEGSRVEVLAHSRVDLLAWERDAAKLRLVSGSLRADITSGQARRWSIQSGPFEVVVLGTAFEVVWQPQPRELSVQVTRGRVVVRGPGLGSGSVLGPGQRLRRVADEPDAGAALRAQDVAPPFEDASLAAPSHDAPFEPAPRRDAPTQAGSKASAGTKRQLKAPPAWTELAQRGDYASAFEQLQDQGWAQSIARADASTLLLMADVARYSQRPQLAQEALLSVRSRWPKKAHARQAAFVLGRLSMDQLRDHQGALAWFELYLREDPEGRWAKEARGLRLELVSRHGGEPAARRAAQEYLHHHPTGPLGDRARRIVGQGSSAP